MSTHTPSGLDVLGELPWGSHVCQFFSTGGDLRETLVPYFKAGLENNERCLLVAMDPFNAEDARSALRAAVGDFDRRERERQIEIRDVRQWYDNDSAIDGERIVAGLLESERRALHEGRAGLRTNGNIGWLQREQWACFQDYEAQVTRSLKGRRMISMCSYCLEKCTSQDVLDAIARHGLTFAPSGPGWSVVAAAPAERARSLDPKLNPADAGEARFRRILDAMPAAIYTTDADGYLTYFNAAAAQLWGYRPEIGKQRWCGTFRILLFDGTEVPRDQFPMAQAIRAGAPLHGIEAYAERPDGTRIACAPFPAPLFDEDGKVVGGINMLVDISQQKSMRDRQSVLTRELDHRIKNNLATVQAIVGSTIRSSRSIEEFQQAFSGRMGALSRTHSLLTDRAQGDVSLRELLNNELDIYADGDGDRVLLSGPEVVLPPHVAVSFGMAIHELTTNALKYGALSALAGRLAVTWQHRESRLRLQWRESNVPIPGEPERVGFGTQLLKRLLPVQLGAEVTMRFGADGLTATVNMPL